MEQSNEEILISIRRNYEDKEVINALYKLLDEKNNIFKELRINFGILVSENDELRYINNILKQKKDNLLINEINTLRKNIKDYMISHKKLKSVRKALRKEESDSLIISKIKHIVFNESDNLYNLNNKIK